MNYTQLFVLLFLFPYQSKGQNLIENGGFESYISVPSSTGAWHRCVGWTNIQGSQVGGPSPDYFHLNGGFPVQLPDNNGFSTHIYPHSGEAIMGFIAFSGTTEFREYLSTPFSSPMVVGETYTISFWISNGEKIPQGAMSTMGATACDHIGIQLSTMPLSQTFVEPIGGIPQFEIPGEFFSTTWKQFSFNFVADSAYNHLSIGNFYPDSLTSTTLQEPLIGNTSYYFIDDFEVSTVSEPINSQNATNVFTPNQDGINDNYSIELNENFKNVHFSILNRWGNKVYESVSTSISWDGKYLELDCSDGVYFWVLKYEDELGVSHNYQGNLTLIR